MLKIQKFLKFGGVFVCYGTLPGKAGRKILWISRIATVKATGFFFVSIVIEFCWGEINTHSIHVWYIYLRLAAETSTNCGEIYHT